MSPPPDADVPSSSGPHPYQSLDGKIPAPRRWTDSLLAFAIVQGGWFACVWSGAHERPGPGLLAMGLTILIQRFREPLWKRDLAAGLILSIPGTISDSLLLNLDIMHYKGQLLPWLAPPWLVLLWIQFGMLLRTSMGFLENRPGLAAGVGLLAAPLAYSGGVRLGAASFGALEWQSLLCLGLEWAVLLPLGVKLAFPRPPASHR